MSPANAHGQITLLRLKLSKDEPDSKQKLLRKGS